MTGPVHRAPFRPHLPSHQAQRNRGSTESGEGEEDGGEDGSESLNLVGLNEYYELRSSRYYLFRFCATCLPVHVSNIRISHVDIWSVSGLTTTRSSLPSH